MLIDASNKEEIRSFIGTEYLYSTFLDVYSEALLTEKASLIGNPLIGTPSPTQVTENHF